MARYFPRSPSANSALSPAELQAAYELQEQSRLLVAAQAAASVSRGANPRAAYGAPTPNTSTAAAADYTPVVITVSESTGSPNPFPRGAPPRQRRRRKSGSTVSSGGRGRKSMEEVLGIYPAEHKLPPGRSAADEFVSALTKRFRFGKTLAPEKGSGHSSAREPIAEAESETPSHLLPPRPKSACSSPSTEREQEQRQLRPGNRARSKSRPRRRIKDRDIPPVPRPSSEILYAHMPLPAVPPPPLPGTQTQTEKENEPEHLRPPSPAASELTLPPNYGIDIAEWAESVFPAPPDLRSLRSVSSRDSALIVEDPPRSSSSASFTLPLWPAASRTTDSGFYGHDYNDEDGDDEATLHLPDTLEELIGPIPELGDTVEYDYADTDSVSTVTEATEAKLAKFRRQNLQSQETTRAQQLDREIAEYLRERREEEERQRSLMHDRRGSMMSYMLEKQREQRRCADVGKEEREEQQKLDGQDETNVHTGLSVEKPPRATMGSLRVFPVVKDSKEEEEGGS